MSGKAVFIVSFGTSFDESRENNILATQRAIEEAMPDCAPYYAFTSNMVRRALQKRGIYIPSIEEALEQMKADGVSDIFCQPTHLIYGEEYDKLCGVLNQYAHAFGAVTVGKPLLADYADMDEVLRVLSNQVERESGEALVLMGHGTEHFCNSVYAAMEYYAKHSGFADVFIGTVEAYPTLDTVLQSVLDAGYKKAVITPLMLVAGDHAHNDMAGEEPDSWRSRFTAAGIDTRTVLKGLGEYAGIRDLYTKHMLCARQTAEKEDLAE